MESWTSLNAVFCDDTLLKSNLSLLAISSTSCSAEGDSIVHL